ncbi:alpha/beta fold hydrolase [Streptomyces sp. NBC_01549]|uniref:alpha/beta fold hydrolase n=1 Tax=unclassified Streptomyces TaxID=2593676 RepID=UPI002253A562|nr:alpha/beta fold hydrolase [Streptomyces sp. NBC_01549]MCX4597318.1 alpha/beta fold hydrolase [Streptomyces sp. NBC_01549]
MSELESGIAVSAGGTGRPTLLLAHGAWHGSWCWEGLTSVLHTDGWTTRTVDLPSAGSQAGVRDDAHVVLQELARIDGPVVVVAHSYGGVPVTQAVAGATDISHIVYLAAYQLDVGESLLSHHGAPAPAEPDGFQPVPEHPIPLFYADAPAADAEAAAGRLVPQSTRSFSDTLTAAGWHTVPSTYVVCEQDQALPPGDQEQLAARSGSVHRLASGHSPFLSMPGEFAALLAKIASEAAG